MDNNDRATRRGSANLPWFSYLFCASLGAPTLLAMLQNVADYAFVTPWAWIVQGYYLLAGALDAVIGAPLTRLIEWLNQTFDFGFRLNDLWKPVLILFVMRSVATVRAQLLSYRCFDKPKPALGNYVKAYAAELTIAHMAALGIGVLPQGDIGWFGILDAESVAVLTAFVAASAVMGARVDYSEDARFNALLGGASRLLRFAFAPAVAWSLLLQGVDPRAVPIVTTIAFLAWISIEDIYLSIRVRQVESDPSSTGYRLAPIGGAMGWLTLCGFIGAGVVIFINEVQVRSGLQAA